MWVLKEVFFLETENSFFPELVTEGQMALPLQVSWQERSRAGPPGRSGAVLFSHDVGCRVAGRTSGRFRPTLSSAGALGG